VTFDPERLHVIRCYERLPPLPGGMEKHIASLTAAQRQLGVRVTEIYNSGNPSGESIQIWPRRRLDQLRPYFLREALFYAAAARKHPDFAQDRYRVVHVHGDWPSFLFGSMFARLLGADAVAATIHEWARGRPRLYAFALRNCDPIFATGLQEARLLERLSGKPVTHLPSAPAELFFGSPTRRAEPSDVIVAGNLVPRKNLELVLEVAALRPLLSFVVYGGGPERGRLEAVLAKKGLNNLRFHGPVEPEALHSAMSSSKLFLNTALAEGSPTAALEAMACGLPAVLTPSNDFSNLIDQGVNGRVTAGWHPDAVAAAIDRFLGDALTFSRARKEARKTAEQHRWHEKALTVTTMMITSAKKGLAG
jgi:glycosyltransferase involved in cell wall biosynthesis